MFGYLDDGVAMRAHGFEADRRPLSEYRFTIDGTVSSIRFDERDAVKAGEAAEQAAQIVRALTSIGQEYTLVVTVGGASETVTFTETKL